MAKPITLTGIKQRSARMVETVHVNLVLPYRFPPPQDKLLRDVAARTLIEEVAAALPPVCGKCGERIPGARASGIVGVVRTYDEILRDFSEQMIMAAAQHVYGENMPKTERKIWRRLHDQIALDDVHVLTMDGASFEWFRTMMTSDKVKVHPRDVAKFEDFVASLEHAERIPAPAVVEPAGVLTSS